MTPEKEAEELIELFGDVKDQFGYSMTESQIKACAAIHCRGVIEVLKKLNPEYEETTYWHPIDHWNKVLELLTNK